MKEDKTVAIVNIKTWDEVAQVIEKMMVRQKDPVKQEALGHVYELLRGKTEPKNDLFEVTDRFHNGKLCGGRILRRVYQAGFKPYISPGGNPLYLCSRCLKVLS